MASIRRLILWDIDGTLISGGPFTRRAFDLAIASALGREPGEHGVSFGGKTDPQIALEILAAQAITADDARGRLPAVMQALEREMGAAVDLLRLDGSVLPGVRPLLERLRQRPGVLQTVLTGNVEGNARLKVGAFGLDGFLDLDVGVYGSDGEDRTTFVPLALQKVESRRGARIDPDAVWVVGDTARDLACARAGGARCLLVATGLVGYEDLVSLGAEAVLHDLSDAEEVERILSAT
ncbi:MAG TPA: HAD family hydrolase [Actinomycetota bacterium]|jgi:phosphoglycolate phosphatase-like HAD superfamily hydrolase